MTELLSGIALWVVGIAAAVLAIRAFLRAALPKWWRRGGMAAAIVIAIMGLSADGSQGMASRIPIALLFVAMILGVTLYRYGVMTAMGDEVERRLEANPRLREAFGRSPLLSRQLRSTRKRRTPPSG